MAIIQEQPPRECELCKITAECRPYGPKGEWVCFKCGMKDKYAAKVMDKNWTSADLTDEELRELVVRHIKYTTEISENLVHTQNALVNLEARVKSLEWRVGKS